MIERIKKLIEMENTNPSSFADSIGISRSSMNHILNGRNNPSLDVLTKILLKYEKINSDWLLFGRVPIYKGEKSFIQASLFDDIPAQVPTIEPKLSSEPRTREYYKDSEPIKPAVEIKIPKKEKLIPPIILPEARSEARSEAMPDARSGAISEVMPKVLPQAISKKITKIMIFYSDQSFDSFNPDNDPFL
ncbi:transcriptional regulator [Bacteroidales bacterium]|nr:transcriptional regulator [Bacteroidales bacterium]